jgi:hypothetical protein
MNRAWNGRSENAALAKQRSGAAGGRKRARKGGRARRRGKRKVDAANQVKPAGSNTMKISKFRIQCQTHAAGLRVRVGARIRDNGLAARKPGNPDRNLTVRRQTGHSLKIECLGSPAQLRGQQRRSFARINYADRIVPRARGAAAVHFFLERSASKGADGFSQRNQGLLIAILGRPGPSRSCGTLAGGPAFAAARAARRVPGPRRFFGACPALSLSKAQEFLRPVSLCRPKFYKTLIFSNNFKGGGPSGLAAMSGGGRRPRVGGERGGAKTSGCPARKRNALAPFRSRRGPQSRRRAAGVSPGVRERRRRFLNGRSVAGKAFSRSREGTGRKLRKGPAKGAGFGMSHGGVQPRRTESLARGSLRPCAPSVSRARSLPEGRQQFRAPRPQASPAKSESAATEAWRRSRQLPSGPGSRRLSPAPASARVRSGPGRPRSPQGSSR